MDASCINKEFSYTVKYLQSSDKLEQVINCQLIPLSKESKLCLSSIYAKQLLFSFLVYFSIHFSCYIFYYVLGDLDLQNSRATTVWFDAFFRYS